MFRRIDLLESNILQLIMCAQNKYFLRRALARELMGSLLLVHFYNVLLCLKKGVYIFV